MTVVSEWANTHKEPITLKEITIIKKEINPRTVRASTEVLCKKGYLRKSCAMGPTAYVLIRKI